MNEPETAEQPDQSATTQPGSHPAVATALQKRCGWCCAELSGKQDKWCGQACKRYAWEAVHPGARAQLALKFRPPVGPQFKGTTYEPKLDQARLGRQLDRVVAFMADRNPHTLSEISHGTGSPEASVSARLRDMKRPLHKHGMGLNIVRTRVKGGLWVYEWARGE